MAPKTSIKMGKKEFVSEHKKLVKVLRGGTRKQLMREAKEQASELKGK